MKKVYFYEGPIYRFDKCVADNVYFETEAVSEAQAINNIKAKCKKYLGYSYSASIDIDEDAVLPIVREPRGQLCPKCGKVYLNDAGDCPVCDLGDEYVLDDYMEDYMPIKESLLTETKRSQIISQSKSGQKYKDGKGNRWDAKKDCSVANTTKDYNKIDMNTFWKEDVLNFDVKVKGLNDIYSVSISFNDALKYIQKQVKEEDNKWNRDIVTKALMLAINNGDIKVNCTCADFKHRFAYIATKKGYKAGEAENRASDETNPEDTLGAACKHILAALNNASWLRNIASVIVNYANYAKENMKQNYDRFIFPKIFNMTAKQAEEQINDEELASDEATINLSIALGKSKAHFKKDSNESLKEALILDETLDKEEDLASHYAKHCEASPEHAALKKERNKKNHGRYGATEIAFTKDEVKSKKDYRDLAYWFAEQKPLTELFGTYHGIKFNGVVMDTTTPDTFRDGTKYTLHIKTCTLKRTAYNPLRHKNEDVMLSCYWFYDIKDPTKIKVKTIYPILKSCMGNKDIHRWLDKD